MATAEAALAALESIAASCASMDTRLKALERHLGAGEMHGATHQPSGMPAIAAIASDRDLDGQYGNPEVKAKSPRDWTGDSQQGKRFSECPPEYLVLVADRLDYFAEQNEEHAADQQAPAEERQALLKKAKYNRIDAARARGWAARLRGGWKAPASDAGFGTVASGEPLTDDQIPF